jgi:hypothetical protein
VARKFGLLGEKTGERLLKRGRGVVVMLMPVNADIIVTDVTVPIPL